MKKDFYCGLFFFGFGLFLWLTIPYSIPQIDLITRMGPRFFPTVFSAAMTILGALLALQSFIQRDKWKKETSARTLILKDEIPIIISFVIMVGACILFAYFRYLISMPVFVTVLLLYYKIKKWHYYLILYGFIVLFYFIFVKLMYVQL